MHFAWDRREETIEVDLLKVSHQGSARNTSPELLDRIRLRHALISTNDCGFDHSNAACVDRLVDSPAENVLHLYARGCAVGERQEARSQYATRYEDQGRLTIRP